MTSITDYDAFDAAAAAGTAAIFVGGNWQYRQLRKILPHDQFANWEVSEHPGPTPSQRASGTGGWSIAALSDDEAKRQLCGEIVKEIHDSPGNAAQGLLPTSTEIYEEYDTYDGAEYDLFAEALQNGVARPGAAIYPEISNQIQISYRARASTRRRSTLPRARSSPPTTASERRPRPGGGTGSCASRAVARADGAYAGQRSTRCPCSTWRGCR